MDLPIITNVHFDELTHSYLLDGDKFIMGVTSLMKKHGLAPDYGDVDPQVLEKAAERGTAIHKLLEAYDNGEVVNETDELKAYKRLGLNVVASEYLITDGEMVASSIDKVLSDGSLADVKTTSEVHTRAVAWQLSIYAYLFERQTGNKVPALYCIHVRNGKAKEIPVARIADEEVEALFQAEREGRIYVDKDAMPCVTDILSADEAEKLRAYSNAIAHLERTRKEFEEAISDFKDKVYQYMTDKGIECMTYRDVTFTRKAPYERIMMDTARFKADHPDLFEGYRKVTEVKGTILIKESKNN